MPTQPQFTPFNLHGLKTYDLQDRPSKVFHDDLGSPCDAETSVGAWLDTLPGQLVSRDLRSVSQALGQANRLGRTVAAAFGGHVIKTGCGPYLIDWMNKGLLTAIAMNGSAAIHDVELALCGKTSEDVGAQLGEGRFGMARETADAFALAAHVGMQEGGGLGHALGRHLDQTACQYPRASVLLTAYRLGIPCTVHVALGTDIVHMHPHVSGAALGEASLIDFRLLCSVVSTLAEGIWMNLGSAVIMPEVFLKAVSVVRNFGHSLDGMITVNLDKNPQYRSRVNVVDRPSARGYELIGAHEIMLPLLHVAVAANMAGAKKHAPARAA